MVVLSDVPEGASSSSPTHGHTSSTHGHSPSRHGHRYDVFISFRGFDTRHSFTDHLYNALIDANITTFLDDEEIETGEDLKPELESAIKASVVVLSENYATSTWCLDELVLILQQRITSNHIVIPIFYHVEPTHVRKQQGSFGDAMAKHKQTMEAETNAYKRSQWAQKMDRWTKALIEVANLKGNDVKGRLETKFIEEIVKGIYGRLRIPLRSAKELLFGIDHHMNFVTSWLKDASSHKADILTILGMGGIGKTSLAKHVYGLHGRDFPASSCIENISRRCDGKFNGLLDVQKQLCGDILKTSSIEVYDVSVYTSMIENAVARKTFFLVLDDVDTTEQLDTLLGSKGFHPGSKIIITTKNAWLTKSCALFKTNNKPKHVELLLQGLYATESLQLLCHHAFTCDHPKVGYEEVSHKLVNYCEGHPLALKVLGKSLHNQDVAYWEGCIEGLSKEVNLHINNVLKMSFDSLPSKNDKELFKYIACYFVGTDRDVTATILEACDINTRSGIKNLIDRFLLHIGWNNKLEMHQLVEEMGKFEVRQESPDKPWKQSRLWSHKDSFLVLKRKKGKGNTLGLALDIRMLEKEKLAGSFVLKTDALSNMDSLMLLQLNYVNINGSYENFPGELRGLCMHGFRLKSIPLDLPMENIVALDMSYSNIESFVGVNTDPQQLEKREKLDGSCLKDKKLLPSLKILNLSFCKQLCSLGDFDQLPALEMLIVRNCIGLVEICETIEHCVELALIELGDISCDLKFFAISLPSSLVTLSLVDNNMFNESFPMDFSCLSMLKELCLDGNPIVSLPNCVRTLHRLESLSMRFCNKLKSVEHPPRTLRELVLFSRRKPFLEKVIFDPEMSPLELFYFHRGFAPGSYEIEGMIKSQAMVDVEEKVLRGLGWTNLDFFNERRNSWESEIEMFYEFGIFSIMYEQKEMPSWIRHRSIGPSISFTIPSSPNNLRGLNLCSLHTYHFPDDHIDCDDFPPTPMITIINVTKNHMWIYERNPDRPRQNCWVLLSHWMFGMNEMEAGDLITITVTMPYGELTKECGVRLVYDDGEEEDALGYYKSWNHIIGGDLSAFQTTTGEYILHNERFSYGGIYLYPYHRKFIPEGPEYQVEEETWFRALSPRKLGIM